MKYGRIHSISRRLFSKEPEMGYEQSAVSRDADKRDLIKTKGFKFQKFMEKHRQNTAESKIQTQKEYDQYLSTYVDFYDTEVKIDLYFENFDAEGHSTSAILNYYKVIFKTVD
jgi:hypothetical protein